MTLKQGVSAIATGFIIMWAVFTTGWLATEKRMNRALQLQVNQKVLTIDSLTSECSAKDIDIDRFYIILDRIAERDSALVEDAMHGVE